MSSPLPPTPTPTPPRPGADPRVATAKRVVFLLGCFALLSVSAAAVLGAYYCATERPAREMFLAPAPAPVDGGGPPPHTPLPR